MTRAAVRRRIYSQLVTRQRVDRVGVDFEIEIEMRGGGIVVVIVVVVKVIVVESLRAERPTQADCGYEREYDN